MIIFAESAYGLRLTLNAVLGYCSIWDLKNNPAKTKIVVFVICRIRNKPEVNYDGVSVDIVDAFVYLEVTLSANGTFKKGQVYAADRANKSFSAPFVDLSSSTSVLMFRLIYLTNS